MHTKRLSLTAVLVAALVAPLTAGACGGKPEAEAQAAAPATETLEFEVVGMHCESCSEAITAKLSKMPGVQAVSVDHESGRAKVEVAGDDTQPPAIIEAIDKLGFEAKVAAAEAETKPAS